MRIILALLLLCGSAMAGEVQKCSTPNGACGGPDVEITDGTLATETPRSSLAFPECPAGYTPVIAPDSAAEFGGVGRCARELIMPFDAR